MAKHKDRAQNTILIQSEPSMENNCAPFFCFTVEHVHCIFISPPAIALGSTVLNYTYTH